MGQGSNDFYPVSLVLANRSACALHLAEQQESSFKSDTLHTNVIRFYCSQGLRDVDQALKLGYKTPSKLWLRRAKLLTIQLMTGVQQEDEETILVEEERGESAGACRWDKVHDCFRQALKSAGSNSAAASIQRDWGDIKRKISSHKRCSNLRRILTFSTGGRGRSDSTTQLEITHTPRISQTDYKERSLVASCDLSQGQVVLTDTLFAATPQHYSDNSSSKRANEPVNCSLLYAACDFCQSPLHGFGIP